MSAGRVYKISRCPTCNGHMSCAIDHAMRRIGEPWCDRCTPRDPEGRLIRAASDVMRAQRAKGIRKYQSTLEDQTGYTIGGMIDMCAEELADGSVYIQKVREQYMALLDELDAVLGHPDANVGVGYAKGIIKRERGRA